MWMQFQGFDIIQGEAYLRYLSRTYLEVGLRVHTPANPTPECPGFLLSFQFSSTLDQK